MNGITDEMVQNEPGLAHILPEFLNFIGGEILIGHNIQSFDLLFLNRVAGEVCGTAVLNDFIDTLYMARACLPGLSHYRLTDLAEYFKISSEGAHRALNDCVMNQICYEHMGKLFEGRGHSGLPQMRGELTKQKWQIRTILWLLQLPGLQVYENIVV